MPIELSRHVGVRFKPDDYRRLERKAERLGVSVSRVIRDTALGVVIAPPRHRLADQDLINQLSRLGNNLNQQTRLLHQLTHRGLTPDLARVLAAVEDVRRLLDLVARSVAEVAR